MSFGYIALATVLVGTAAYSADASRKGQHEVADAQKASDEADARQKAELDTSTAVAANAKYAADKRARQANVLALGGGTSPLGGGSNSSLPAGGVPQSAVTSNVLGSGGSAGGTVGGPVTGRQTTQPVRQGATTY